LGITNCRARILIISYARLGTRNRARRSPARAAGSAQTLSSLALGEAREAGRTRTLTRLALGEAREAGRTRSGTILALGEARGAGSARLQILLVSVLARSAVAAITPVTIPAYILAYGACSASFFIDWFYFISNFAFRWSLVRTSGAAHVESSQCVSDAGAQGTLICSTIAVNVSVRAMFAPRCTVIVLVLPTGTTAPNAVLARSLNRLILVLARDTVSARGPDAVGARGALSARLTRFGVSGGTHRYRVSTIGARDTGGVGNGGAVTARGCPDATVGARGAESARLTRFVGSGGTHRYRVTSRGTRDTGGVGNGESIVQSMPVRSRVKSGNISTRC